jgi:hypothetical protein
MMVDLCRQIDIESAANMTKMLLSLYTRIFYY